MTENKTVQINPQLIQIFTLLDMVLKKTVINKVKKKDDKMETFIRTVGSWGKTNKWTL